MDDMSKKSGTLWDEDEGSRRKEDLSETAQPGPLRARAQL